MSTLKPIVYLLVEDSQDHAELMTDSLESANAENIVVHMRDGEEARRYLYRLPPYEGPSNPTPELIILDLKMPRLNGIEILSIIKSHPEIRHIPVVVISTTKADKEVKRCYDLGASSFITKPVRFEEFSNKIEILNLYWAQAAELPN